MSRALLALASLAVSLAIAEGIVRMIPPARLGFEFRDGRFERPREFVSDRIRNAQGFHDLPFEHGSGLRLVLLGDSYAEGYGVALGEMVGRQVEERLEGWRVTTLARSNWGQREELAALREHGAALAPALVVTLLLPLNDVRNNSPVLQRRANEQIAELAHARPGWTSFDASQATALLFESSALNRLVSHRLARAQRSTVVPIDYFVYVEPASSEWKAAWGATEDLLRRTRGHAAALGARYALAVASTPQGVLGADAGRVVLEESYPAIVAHEIDLDMPAHRLAAFAEREGIPFLWLEPAFREATARGEMLHYPYDGHWNAAGHALAGREVAEWIRQLGDSGGR